MAANTPALLARKRIRPCWPIICLIGIKPGDKIRAVDIPEDGSLPYDPKQLLRLADYRMPFGKYTNRLLIDLPEPYVVWFAGEGFPAGELGDMLRIVHEIKVNGLEYLFDPLRK